MKATILNNGFGIQFPDAAYGGTGNLYGLIASHEVVNPATSGTPNLHLIHNAMAIDHGTSASVPAVDKDLVSRPQGVTWDMGAYEYALVVPTVCTTMTEYLNLSYTNPQDTNTFNYDLLPTAGAASTGHNAGVTGTTGVNIGAIGAALTTVDYIFQPYQFPSYTPPTGSETPVSAAQGYGFTMASPLASDLVGGTWTFSNRFENNIGAIAGGLAVNMEYAVYSYNSGSNTDTLLFTGVGTQLYPPAQANFTPYTITTTSAQPAFPGTAGTYIHIEYYVRIVGNTVNPGMWYFDFNTNQDYVSIPSDHLRDAHAHLHAQPQPDAHLRGHGPGGGLRGGPGHRQ